MSRRSWRGIYWRSALTALSIGLNAATGCSPEAGPAKCITPASTADASSTSAPIECACEGSANVTLTHGPVLGAVTDRSIEVWGRADDDGWLLVRWWPQGDPSASKWSRPVRFDRSLDHTAVALLTELVPSTSYEYRVVIAADSDECCESAGEGAFHTLPPAGEPARIRFAVGADVRGADVPGFADIQAVSPDFVLMIGDNVYADDLGADRSSCSETFARYQSLYQTVWGGSQFRALFAGVPSFMIWDDHELIENYWAGKDDFIYSVGRNLFDSYQGSHNPAPIHEGELYYSFGAGDISFFVLDVRTHRDGNLDEDDADKSMLGAAQRKALEQWLADDSSRVHVIVSPVLFSNLATTGKDPWRSFSVERTGLLDTIAERQASNVFIISGDQHWSAILKIEHGDEEPYAIYEFQTTPLGSGTRSAPQHPTERVIALDNRHRVFGVFDIDTRQEPPRMDFTLCAVGKPCSPHAEQSPISLGPSRATVPYSVFFEGTRQGFVMLADSPD